MSRIGTMLAVWALLAGATPALAERDLGLHPIGSAVDLIWTAREVDACGHWIGSSAMRGLLDDTDKGRERFRRRVHRVAGPVGEDGAADPRPRWLGRLSHPAG